jgi:glutathione-specific gamma-glutamylcyclotransferase
MSAGKRNRKLALTRALITRAQPNAVTDDSNAVRLRSDEELKAGLDHVLGHRADDGLWLFAYGSLIWKPEIEVAEPGGHRTGLA